MARMFSIPTRPSGVPQFSIPLSGPVIAGSFFIVPPIHFQAILRVKNAGDDDAPLAGGGLNSVGPFEVIAVSADPLARTTVLPGGNTINCTMGHLSLGEEEAVI